MVKVSYGELSGESEASNVRRTTARINYMVLGRANLSCVVSFVSEYMSEPKQVTEIVVKSAIRYLQSCPWMLNNISKRSDECQEGVEIMTDSDWAGGTKTRRSSSVG